MYYALTNTPAGTLLLIGDGKTITGMHWEVFKRRPSINPEWTEDMEAFSDLMQQLDEYFAGTRQVFDFEYAAKGTEFQMKVWRELAKIPYGVRSSYQAIAGAVGNPKAARAVGTAVGSNPISIVIPCHRVLTSIGKLGGYAGGFASKTLLLELEDIGTTGALNAKEASI
jgi:methylated-DNA-[protein]-cysteine S-methyltransferase